MKTKTFKIGECCRGGIILVIIGKKDIAIKALDWNTKKVVLEDLFPIKSPEYYDYNAEQSMDNFLNQLSTCYFADKVLKYIKENVTFSE